VSEPLACRRALDDVASETKATRIDAGPNASTFRANVEPIAPDSILVDLTAKLHRQRQESRIYCFLCFGKLLRVRLDVVLLPLACILPCGLCWHFSTTEDPRQHRGILGFPSVRGHHSLSVGPDCHRPIVV
jgi:hypothetical protein